MHGWVPYSPSALAPRPSYTHNCKPTRSTGWARDRGTQQTCFSIERFAQSKPNYGEIRTVQENTKSAFERPSTKSDMNLKPTLGQNELSAGSTMPRPLHRPGIPKVTTSEAGDAVARHAHRNADGHDLREESQHFVDPRRAQEPHHLPGRQQRSSATDCETTRCECSVFQFKCRRIFNIGQRPHARFLREGRIFVCCVLTRFTLRATPRRASGWSDLDAGCLVALSK